MAPNGDHPGGGSGRREDDAGDVVGVLDRENVRPLQPDRRGAVDERQDIGVARSAERSVATLAQVEALADVSRLGAARPSCSQRGQVPGGANSLP